jgi:chitinase
VPVLLGGAEGTASNSKVTVSFTTGDRSATAGSDYATVSGKLTFAPGQTVQNVVVPITDDAVAEPAEAFAVMLGATSHATVVDREGVVTVGANDQTPVATPRLSVGPDVLVSESDGYVDLAVGLSGPGTKAVSVGYTAATGTAGGFDFLGASGTLTFAVGETTKVVRIEIEDDASVERLESFSLNLSAPVNATVARRSALLSIVDNDTVVATPVLFVRDAVVDESAGTVSVPVLLGGAEGTASNSKVTVSFTTGDRSATAGSDYATVSGTLTFAPGQTVQNVVVPITDDAVEESAETLAVRLTHPTNAALGDGVSSVTIGANDQTPVALPQLSVGPDASVGEGAGYVDVVVSLDAPGTSNALVDYATATGTAGGFDFLGASGTLTFAVGETTKVVRIEIEDDAAVELSETFTLTLSNASNATIARPTIVLTIVDND